MQPPTPADLYKWTEADTTAASREGWNLFSIDHASGPQLDIQREDELEKFSSDGDALMHVYKHAMDGSALHQKALQLSLQTSPAFIPPRIGMDVTGGVIQCAFADHPAVIYAIDCDNDDVDDEHLSEVTYPDGESVVGQILMFSADVVPGHVDALRDAPPLAYEEEEDAEDEDSATPRP